MSKRKSRDPLTLEIVRDLEQRGFHIDVESVESIEATVAKFRAAEEDKFYGIYNSCFDIIEALQQLVLERTYWHEWAAAVRREHAKLTDQLRRSGERNAAARAWEQLAPEYNKSPQALSRSVRARNR